MLTNKEKQELIRQEKEVYENHTKKLVEEAKAKGEYDSTSTKIMSHFFRR